MSEAPMTKVEARQSAGLKKRWLPLLVLVALMVLTFAFGWHKYLSFKTIGLNYEAMKSFIGENFFAALALYMLIYIAAVALSAPGGLIMTLSGGLLFGWQVGAPATIVAATIGATLLFLIAKTSLGEGLAAKAGPWLAKLQETVQGSAGSFICCFLRTMPLFRSSHRRSGDNFWVCRSELS